MDNIYVHFGSEHFDRERFLPISNIVGFVKPEGGFWGSPLNTPRNWENWCRDNKIWENRLESKFYFKLKPGARKLYIHNSGQLRELPKATQPEIFPITPWDLLDFEKLKDEYDAIEITLSYEDGPKDFWETGLYHRLYGWDVDSILVMNPDIIEEIENLAENA